MTDKNYKVWVKVEEIDLATDEYTSDPVPEPAGVFTTEEEARALQQRLVGYAEGMESTREY